MMHIEGEKKSFDALFRFKILCFIIFGSFSCFFSFESCRPFVETNRPQRLSESRADEKSLVTVVGMSTTNSVTKAW